MTDLYGNGGKNLEIIAEDVARQSWDILGSFGQLMGYDSLGDFLRDASNADQKELDITFKALALSKTAFELMTTQAIAIDKMVTTINEMNDKINDLEIRSMI